MTKQCCKLHAQLQLCMVNEWKELWVTGKGMKNSQLKFHWSHSISHLGNGEPLHYILGCILWFHKPVHKAWEIVKATLWWCFLKRMCRVKAYVMMEVAGREPWRILNVKMELILNRGSDSNKTRWRNMGCSGNFLKNSKCALQHVNRNCPEWRLVGYTWETMGHESSIT